MCHAVGEHNHLGTIALTRLLVRQLHVPVIAASPQKSRGGRIDELIAG
jgi:hypothetical protein